MTGGIKRPGPPDNKNSCKFKRKFFYRQSDADRRDEELKQVITDHALVRYLQRVYGLNIAELRAEVIGENLPVIQEIQNGKINHNDYVLVCAEGKVVTIKSQGKHD